jgi:uroporphyrinogen III methyltransferase / synthase
LSRREDAGCVYLVGAGPGDPGLLTTRSLELLAAADVILYDRLIPTEALSSAKPGAELIFVGKQTGSHSMPQEEIASLLVRRAGEGKMVVRLKGGDPFVFGRGGEEALALRAGGIPFQVVPGVTSGVAAAAYAGIPVTHRGLSLAVAFVTGHGEPGGGEPPLDWRALATFPGTLVFFMGVRQLAEIASRLSSSGRAPTEPVAIIEQGTLPAQRTLAGTLADIVERAREHDVRPPAIVVVGPVAALSQELDWLTQRPLHGRTVAVTRSRAQASELARRLRELGADVIEAPVIQTRPVEHEPIDPSGYDLVCAMSPNAVAALFASLAAGDRDARALAGARVAAIGPGTARALAEHGITADLIPERFVAESLVDALGELPVTRALVVRAREGREVLTQALRERGVEVDVAGLYETVAQALPSELLAQAASADYITFTSSSTVRYFLRALDGTPSQSTRLVSIGPATSQTLREHGLEPTLEAEPHDIDGLIAALLADAA